MYKACFYPVRVSLVQQFNPFLYLNPFQNICNETESTQAGKAGRRKGKEGVVGHVAHFIMLTYVG